MLQILLESFTCQAVVQCRLQEAPAVRLEVGQVERQEADVPGDRGADRQQEELLVEDVAVQRVRTIIRFHVPRWSRLAWQLHWLLVQHTFAVWLTAKTRASKL